ncbi:uncharacterized protein LOC105435199 isoform X1 [Cucumis sativus]|uniref:uncharacterized protein LOC105435199 isoform X1 n=1 Tax=Cucumis sativus TaxID=3659 RepID=UPI0005ECE2CA|nr:uncharacterized protein LOC105435199 isoform X1 [Cucumis sativus]XP_011653326.1 uncharacterized protein LOC105435199 isoform X1 [Cucumis sativus]XP_011653327.1 uncharacterized protein LOC105435199 isoform X1 [Cucumis sativus]KAE8649268.1 hypothetical protein Csa_014577 [Cucumis sativus]
MKDITHFSSEGWKMIIQYNELGQPIRPNATKLKSFIGRTVRFHVPITYSTWHAVPKEMKEKIYELIEGDFILDPKSKKSILQNVRICFSGFKLRLTTTYVLSLKDDVENLKRPPAEYSFIDEDHWDEFVASRLKEDFEKKSEEDKLKRKLYKYNHRTSRKGYANLVEELRASSLSNQIDRSIVWKHAHLDHKGEFPDKEMKDVANVIDNLLGNQKTRSLYGSDDVLNQALGVKDRLGITLRRGEVRDYEKNIFIPRWNQNLKKVTERRQCMRNVMK